MYQNNFSTYTLVEIMSKKHVESYFNEFSYRINRSQNRNTIFHNIIQRMVNSKPLQYDKLIRKLNG